MATGGSQPKQDQDASTSTFKNSKRAYEKVLRVVHHQTSPAQEPMVETEAINVTCCVSGDLDPATVKSKLKRAVTNGDLIEADGRYCVTDDLARLRRAAKAVAEQVPVDQQVLGEINGAVKKLKEEQ